nr:ATP-dependent DNA helicase [uncultured Fusobacterium sp.]
MLNEKQLEAVNTTEGPVVVVAGPGTGKTKTLIERVVNILVNKKVDANRIMLTTFTNKAARELEIRINEKLKELNENIDISDMYLGTMHSIWTRLIEENISYSNFFDGFTLMSGNYEQHFFIFSRLKEYRNLKDYQSFFDNLSYNDDGKDKEKKYNSNWQKSSFIRDKINDLNENAIDIENIKTEDKYINFIKEAYKLYEHQLFQANTLDFSYLQVEFLNMLIKSPDFLKKINDKFDYIMVDEYQDSNRIQEKILFLISREKKNICVVGDEDQSIYRFRGASAENILNFPKKFAEDECKVIILEKNYRSVNDIVQFNNSWIKDIDWADNRYDKNIISMREEDIFSSNVYHISGKNISENIRNTVTFIKKLKVNKKITNYNQVAVLFSRFTGRTPKELEDALKKENIEVYSPRTKQFFEMYEIKVALGTVLGYFKKYFPAGIDDEYLNECLDSARIEIQKDEKFKLWIKDKIPNISSMSFESFNEILYEFFEFDYYKNILKEQDANTARASHNLSLLTKIFKNYQKYVHYKRITVEDNFSIARYFFDGYMKILRRARIDEIFSEEDYPNDCIPFLTIHQAKGLEFPVVIVFSLDSKPEIDKDFSKQTSLDRLVNTNSKISEIDKERFDFYRKFYVAFTRAKNLLVLSSYELGVSEKFKNFFFSVSSVNSLKFDIDTVELDKFDEKKDKKIISYTTDISVYNLCPRRYWFIREKKYSTFEKTRLAFGNIVHKAIEHINKLFIARGNIKILDDVYIENLLKNIYKFENIDLDQDFQRAILLIKKYIDREKENFKYMKKVEASEYRVEEDYMLYGKIDLVLEDENNISIIDFKTGKYKEDKNSNYREQLSLYKLLLQNKTKKNILTFLYYLEEDEPKKEILITDEELQEDFIAVNLTVENILNEKFLKIPYDENICEACEFKFYCWGEK